MNLINKLGWKNEIKKFFLHNKKSIFGICLGMQILSSTGREHGETDGLNLIDGEVLHLDNDVGCRLPTPHIGWNEIDIKKKKLFLIIYLIVQIFILLIVIHLKRKKR